MRSVVMLAAICSFFVLPVGSAAMMHGMMAGTGAQTGHFTDATHCGGCHTWLRGVSGSHQTVYNDWGSSMMANAGRDPVFLAKVETDARRVPGQEAELERKCSRCHTPMAWSETLIQGGEGRLRGGGFLDPANPVHGLAMDGVSCTLCHQIRPEGLGTVSTFTGSYLIDADPKRPWRLISGPFPNPVARPMQMWSGFIPEHAPHVTSSALCGSCHTLYMPYLDDKGEVAGVFAEQATYLEWRDSAYARDAARAKSCQDCHLPVAGEAVFAASMPHHLAPREGFSRHTLVGGNTAVLTMLRDNPQALGVAADPGQFDRTLEKTMQQLETRTARVSIEDARAEGTSLRVRVRVTNLAGHKLPSGFPVRRVWVHFTATDASGRVLLESGRPGAGGVITGCDADADDAAFEPHHLVIDSPEKVQVYEVVMGDMRGDVTFSLPHAAMRLKDNRLLPAGCDKTSAHPDVRPCEASAGDGDFGDSGDVVEYVVPLDGRGGEVRLQTSLYYQPLGLPFLRDIKRAQGPAIDRLKALHAATDVSAVRMAGHERVFETGRP